MKRWSFGSTFLLGALLCCCASSPGGSAQAPSVTISQLSRVDPVDAVAGTAVPVEFRLEIKNPLSNEVTLTSVEIETVGAAGGYDMRRVRHQFQTVVPAGATESVDLRAWVRPLQVSQTGDVVTSVILRGTAQFDSKGTPLRTSFTGRLAQR